MTQELVISFGEFNDFDPMLRQTAEDWRPSPESLFLTSSSLTNISFVDSGDESSSLPQNTSAIEGDQKATASATEYLESADTVNREKIAKIEQELSKEREYTPKALKKLETVMKSKETAFKDEIEENDNLMALIAGLQETLKQQRDQEFDTRMKMLDDKQAELEQRKMELEALIELDVQLQDRDDAGTKSYDALKKVKKKYPSSSVALQGQIRQGQIVDYLEDKLELCFKEQHMEHLFPKTKDLILSKYVQGAARPEDAAPAKSVLAKLTSKVKGERSAQRQDFLVSFKKMVAEDQKFQVAELKALDFDNALKRIAAQRKSLESVNQDELTNENIQSSLASLQYYEAGLADLRIDEVEAEYIEAQNQYKQYAQGLKAESQKISGLEAMLIKLEGLQLNTTLGALKNKANDSNSIFSPVLEANLLEASKARESLLEIRSELVGKLHGLDLTSTAISTEQGKKYAADIAFAVEVDGLLVVKENYLKEDIRLNDAANQLEEAETDLDSELKKTSLLIEGLEQYKSFLEELEDESVEIDDVDAMLAKLHESNRALEVRREELQRNRVILNDKLDNIDQKVDTINDAMANLGEVGRKIAQSTHNLKVSYESHIDVLNTTQGLLDLLAEELKASQQEAEVKPEPIFVEEDEEFQVVDDGEEEDEEQGMSLFDELNMSLADELAAVGEFNGFVQGSIMTSTPQKKHGHKRSETVAWTHDVNGEPTFYSLQTSEEKDIARAALSQQRLSKAMAISPVDQAKSTGKAVTSDVASIPAELSKAIAISPVDQAKSTGKAVTSDVASIDHKNDKAAAKPEKDSNINSNRFDVREFVEALEHSHNNQKHADEALLQPDTSLIPTPATNKYHIKGVEYAEIYTGKTYDALVGAINASNSNVPQVHDALAARLENAHNSHNPQVAEYLNKVLPVASESTPRLSNDISLDKLNSEVAQELHANGYKIGEIFTEFITRRHLNGGMSGAIMAATTA